MKRALAIRESPCGEKRVEGVEIHYNYRQQGEATYLEFAWFFQILLVNVVTARPAVKAGWQAQYTGKHFFLGRNAIFYVILAVQSMKKGQKNPASVLYAAG